MIKSYKWKFIEGRFYQLSTTLIVTFKEHNQITQKIEFFDPINLSGEQQGYILDIASKYTRQELIGIEQGIDIEPKLTNSQQKAVLRLKNEIIGDYTADKLFDRDIVKLTGHSLKRLVELTGNNKRPDIIGIIQKVIDGDKVQKAQFKGYTQLSYTLMTNDSRDKTPISFLGNETKISVVTLTIEGKVKQLQQPLIPNDLRDKLLKAYQSKKDKNN